MLPCDGCVGYSGIGMLKMSHQLDKTSCAWLGDSCSLGQADPDPDAWSSEVAV